MFYIIHRNIHNVCMSYGQVEVAVLNFAELRAAGVKISSNRYKWTTNGRTAACSLRTHQTKRRTDGRSLRRSIVYA